MSRIIELLAALWVLSIVGSTLAAVWARDIRWAGTALVLAAFLALVTILGRGNE